MQARWRLPVRVLMVAAMTALSACAGPKLKHIEVDPGTAALEAEKQRQFVVRSYTSELLRLYRVGYPVKVGAAAFCADAVQTQIGAVVMNAHFFTPDLRAAANRELGLNEWPTVVYVAPGSPADEAGLQEGDIIRSFGGKTIGPGETGLRAMYQAAFALDDPAKPVRVGVARGRQQKVFDFHGEPGCGYPMTLGRSDGIGAFADGNRIIVTRGMMRFLSNDAELATVIGHEISHNALHHIDATQQNIMAGKIAGLAVDILFAAAGVDTRGTFSDVGPKSGALAYSQEFEAEADYMGVYAAARAGFDISHSSNLWRRMASAHPGSIGYASTHPTSAYRAAAIDKIVKEIELKQVAGLPLHPDSKGADSTTALAQLPSPGLAKTAAISPIPATVSTITAVQPSAEAAPVRVARRAPAQPAEQHWIGAGRADACGNPWRIDLAVKSDDQSVEGRMILGDIAYDLYGRLDYAGETITGHGGKNERSAGRPGPRFIDFKLAFEGPRAVGTYSINGYGRNSCFTDFVLKRDVS